jgi:hypothetical protein
MIAMPWRCAFAASLVILALLTQGADADESVRVLVADNVELLLGALDRHANHRGVRRLGSHQ